MTVIVGREGQPFYIHPSILVKSSRYLQALLSKRWTAGDASPVHLPDDDVSVNTFSVYCRFLYHGELELDDESLDLKVEDPYGLQRYKALTEVFILGDQLNDTAVRNVAMDQIIELEMKIRYRPSLEAYKLAFSRTPANSSICRFLTDNALCGTSADWLKDCYEELPPSFLEALTLGWARHSCDQSVVFASPLMMPRCTYHEHDLDTPKTEECALFPDKQEAVKPVTPKTPAKRKR